MRDDCVMMKDSVWRKGEDVGTSTGKVRRFKLSDTTGTTNERCKETIETIMTDTPKIFEEFAREEVSRI